MSLARRPTAAGLAAAFIAAAPLHAQVTTTATLAGRVSAEAGGPVPAAQVTAVHRPSGTTYRATVRADGRFTIPGMRVGGPYTVTVRALGFAPATRDNLTLALGTQSDVAFALATVATRLNEVTVQAATTTGTLSAARTGAATNVDRAALATLPTISRTIGDFTRLTPQASANGSFGGLDSRFNNTTIDGAQFNNAFGLGTGQPGGRTNVSPIPLDAIDQIQVNVAPYDVRQGSFVGASVNAVTRSGTNNVEGSLYYFGRNQRFVGREAAGARFNPGRFSFGQVGARLGGPILRDRLFFFASFEDDGLTQPGTTFLANAGGQAIGGNTTRVLATDAAGLSTFLADKFKYETGPVSGYDFETPSRRALAKLDFNANDANKFSLRYTLLNSSSDFPVSNSNSLGFGNRRGSTNALSYANSGYAIQENLRSVVGEWNAQYGARFSNNFLTGYTTNDESRKYKGAIFPTVDVLDPTTQTTYLNFGFEPFTPANQLRYHTFQAQDNLTAYAGNHELTFGASFEKYRSENVFFPGSQSVYVYNSLADFYTDANDFLANPARTTSPVALRRFELRYNNIPGQTEPLQPLDVTTYGGYAQDQWRVTPRVSLTAGVRVDVPVFGATALANAQADALTFRDEQGNALQYQTEKLPDTRALFSPRLGFNWNARGDRATQVRGGTGVFSGRPAYVWISNQLGQNGILTGFDQLNNTRARPFNPSPDAYKPATVTGAPAASYELNFTDKNFRFPQQWRSNLAVDQRLPGGLVATGEVIYGRDLNGVYYINANLPAPQARFTGADQRPRWVNPAGVTTNPTRINQNITAAYVLKNQDVGYNYNLSASLEKSFRAGLFLKAAYNYGVARNTIDPGSIASGSFTGNAIARDPNNPGVAYSANSPGHRAIVAASYRREYFRLGATTLSLFGEYANANNTVPGGFIGANASYVYGGDMNGDGAPGNDLIYVPRDMSEMNFLPIAATSTSPAFSAELQKLAWDQYINQDRYLRTRRGQYAERNAVFLPAFFRADASLAQEVFRPAGGKRNALQIRLDVFNVTNLLNNSWGVGRQLVSNQPLAYAGADAAGAPTFRLRVVNNQLLSQTFTRTAGVNDVYRVQLGARYTFQ